MTTIQKEIDIDKLIENLEKLNHFLLFKNRNFVRKFLKNIINDLKKK